MFAQGDSTQAEIARAVKCSPAMICLWAKEPEFQAEVERLRAIYRAQIFNQGLADKKARLAKYEDLIARMYQVIEGRAAGRTAALVDGGASGLIAHDVKFGKMGDPIDIGRFDKALVSEVREVLKQIAIEVGDWQERQTITNVDVRNLTDEQLERIANGEPVEGVIAGPCAA